MVWNDLEEIGGVWYSPRGKMWLGMGREVYVASLVGGQGVGVTLVLSVKVCI